MSREDEIVILINYLTEDVLSVSKYPGSLTDRIIKNGKLIENYKTELEELKKQKGL